MSKVVVLEGSPKRGGNTDLMCEAFAQAAEAAGHQVKVIPVGRMHIDGCRGCRACYKAGKPCVFGDKDEWNGIAPDILSADAIVFATPVYWWGITGQLKLVLDKFYACHEEFQKLPKKVGTIVIGEARLEDPQYEIIEKQFWCICDYLCWDKVFSKSYSANLPTDLHDQPEALEEIKGLAEVIAKAVKDQQNYE